MINLKKDNGTGVLLALFGCSPIILVFIRIIFGLPTVNIISAIFISIFFTFPLAAVARHFILKNKSDSKQSISMSSTTVSTTSIAIGIVFFILIFVALFG